MSMNIMKWEKMSSPYSEDAWMEFAQKVIFDKRFGCMC